MSSEAPWSFQVLILRETGNIPKGKVFFFFLIYFWLHGVFVAALGLFSSCGELGPLFVAEHGLLIAVASLVAEHGL